MNMPDAAEVLHQLHKAVQSGLSVEKTTHGTKLIARLTGPVRILILGRQGSGKSLLSQLLCREKGLPALQISEMTVQSNPEHWAKATSQADITLWCAQEFDAVELADWAKLPDTVKDHGFLVITKADLLAKDGTLQSTMERMTRDASDEFHSLFPLATRLAIDCDDANHDRVMQTSGAATLITALCRQITLARGAARDLAYVFLDRHCKSVVTTAPVYAETAKVRHNTVPSFWTGPVSFLQQQSAQLGDVATVSLPEKIRIILDHCRATMDGLANLTDPFEPTSSDAIDIRQEILEVADTMVLLQLEQTASAANDALALLLQLRHDMRKFIY